MSTSLWPLLLEPTASVAPAKTTSDHRPSSCLKWKIVKAEHPQLHASSRLGYSRYLPLLGVILLMGPTPLLGFQIPFQRNTKAQVFSRRAIVPFSTPDGDATSNGDDWRAFRAGLVQQEQQGGETSEATPTTVSDADASIKRWAYDAGDNVEAGTILLSIPTNDLCQALEQQFWHRCVVLMTKCSEDGTYYGLLLNRPTTKVRSDLKDEGWNMWYGGDMPVVGTIRDDNDDSQVICLHSCTSPEAQAVSQTIFQGVLQTTLADARALVQNGVATYADFYCFQGRCQWNPGQLETEMGEERGEWYASSFDATSILDELGKHTSTPMWDTLVRMLGKSDEATTQLPGDKLRLYDQMLNAWMDDNLAVQVPTNSTVTSTTDIGPGTLLRATERTFLSQNPPYLLDEQDFHRSLIVVLSNDDESTVGLQLNLLLGGIVELTDTVSLPIRYGGPIYPDDIDAGREEDAMWFWLHRSRALRMDNKGSPLGSSGLWIIDESDAIDAIQSGVASPDEIMVFGGICVWEKGKDLGDLGGGLKEQVEAIGTMEVVSPEKVGTIWKLLTSTKAVEAKTVGENIATTVEAWEAAGAYPSAGSNGMSLGDAALGAWLTLATGSEYNSL